MNEVNAGRPTKVEKRFRVKKMIEEEMAMTKKIKEGRRKGNKKKQDAKKGGVFIPAMVVQEIREIK